MQHRAVGELVRDSNEDEIENDGATNYSDGERSVT